MARSSSRSTDRSGNRPAEHARLPIQLERLPFATLDGRVTARQQLTLSLVYGGEVATWEASASAPNARAAELPGPFGNDLWVALGRVWNTLSLPAGADVSPPAARTIEVTYADLLRLMNKPAGKSQYDAIEETLARLQSVLIVAQGTWKDGTYVRQQVRFPLLDMTSIKTRRDGDAAQNTVTLRLSIEVAEALVRHPRFLDTTQLYRLSSPTARRLYRLLEAERFNRDRRGAETLNLTLTELRDRLPLEETKATHLKRTLNRAHAELVEQGFLLDEPTYTSVKIPGVRAPVVSVTYRFPAAPVVATIAAPVDGMSSPTNGSSPQHTSESGTAAAPIENAARQQLASLLGIAAAPNGRRSSDLAWWVREVERSTGDTRSSGFYKQVVEAFLAAGEIDALEFVLRGVQRDGQGMSGKALGAAFNNRIKARAAELAIALPGVERRGKGRQIGEIINGQT